MSRLKEGERRQLVIAKASFQATENTQDQTLKGT